MNRKMIIPVILTLLLLLACVTACQAASPGQTTDPETSQAEEMTGNEMQSEPDPAAGEETMIYAHIGDKTLTIRSIAEAHGVSSAQVILRWDLQRGIVVIPGSSNPEHIKENLDLFGFALTDEEMAAISNLDRNEKHDWY